MLVSYLDSEEYQNRCKKLEEVKQAGVDPFPPTFSPSHRAEDVHRLYDQDPVGSSEDAEQKRTPLLQVAGRLVLFRGMGKNAFAHLLDGTSRLQILCSRDHTHVEGLGPEQAPMKWIEKKLDLGDILGVEGHVFRTKTGELTLLVTRLTLLCKSLLPLPDKHSGLLDKEIRYRKRWLDLISHSEVYDTFLLRSRVLSILRSVMADHEFIEVETPILQSVYGGAQAKPFLTHLNAIDQEVFLRISLEISLKKLLIGGFPRIFEIGKVFRNESIDRTHNPEFTMIEAYAAYWDYEDMMRLIEKLIETICLQLFGSTQLHYKDDEGQDEILDFTTPWKRMTMVESIQHYAQISVMEESDESMRQRLQATPLDPKVIASASRGLLIALLFDELVSKQLVQPHHITDHPIETTPLCKPHRDPFWKEQGFVERFESFVLGKELCNAYTELNDPLLQRKLLEQQAARLAAGDEEANPMDEEFLEAICYGMPPAGGIGIGIDRLVMLLARVPSIRDVLFFPIMR